MERNLELGANALGVIRERLCFARQVHGRSVLALEDGSSAARALESEADGIVSMASGFACAVRTADCVPILVADQQTGGVAAIHAGWRGVELNVVEAAVSRLRELIGGEGRLLAAIGPHIELESFEVSLDVAQRLEAASPVTGVVDCSGAKPHVDLARIVAAQLIEVGLDSRAVERVGGCTVRDSRSYFSYRRDGALSGRHLHAIVVRGGKLA